MQVKDILQVKGNFLVTVDIHTRMQEVLTIMAKQDIGSLIVMDHGAVVGVVTFREIIAAFAKNQQTQLMQAEVKEVMCPDAIMGTSDMTLDEVRRIMLEQHVRYLPIIDGKTLEGVISFRDVARAIVEAQDQENAHLRSYIHDTYNIKS